MQSSALLKESQKNALDHITMIVGTHEDECINRFQTLVPNGFNVKLKGAALKLNEPVWGDT